MSHDHKEKEPEELAVQAYMDSLAKGVDAPNDKDRIERYHERYKFVKHQAKVLQMEREEIEASNIKDKEQLLLKMYAAFSENYKSRKTIVTELRRLGEKIDDTLIPLSAT